MSGAETDLTDLVGLWTRVQRGMISRHDFYACVRAIANVDREHTDLVYREVLINQVPFEMFRSWLENLPRPKVK